MLDVLHSETHTALPEEVSGHTNEDALLERIMAYQNEALVHRLIEKGGFSESDARGIFDDTKRFLFLCGGVESDGPLAPPELVDEGWHAFLLFTEDYAKFCQQFFGKFIHHRPRRPEDIPGDGSVMRRTMAQVERVFGNVPSKR
jgi:hypothetical protein